MAQPIVLFEDEKYLNFLPIVYFRPVWEVLCGAKSLQQKIERFVEGDIYFLARDYLLNYYLPSDRHWRNLKDQKEILALNGRWLANDNEIEKILSLQSEQMLVSDDNVVAVRTSPKELSKWVENGILRTQKAIKKFTLVSHRARFLNFIWDAIEFNGDAIRRDFIEWIGTSRRDGEIYEGVHLINPQQIHIEDTAVIKPGVVIDASDGPVWIDRGAHIMANSVLMGPLYVGRNSIIKIAAKIYENTTIGAVCKIGGEVEASIIQGFSNKQHEGFLGHAYLGSWVNLGADTNNSDLKNNYGNITVFLNGRPLQTNKMFLGLIMGDHSKTAINTMFNTGTIVGVNCNIFGSGMPPKFVPSFSWGGAEGLQDYRLDKALAVAQKMMARRKQPFTENYRRLFEEVHAQAKRLEERI